VIRKVISLPNRIFDVINYALISVFTLAVFYPFYYCVMLSFNDGKDATQGGIYFWPRIFTLENYNSVFKEPLMLTAARNSILRTVLGVVAGVLLTAMFSYAVSRPKLRFQKFYMTIGVITMYFGGGLIPFYLQIRNLGLLNNFFVYIWPNVFTMFNALILLTFFKGLPIALEESAKMDGANDFIIFFRIIFPLSMPVIATIALFIGVRQWNSWFDTMLYTRTDELETLSHLMVKMINTAHYYEEAVANIATGSHAAARMRGITANALQLATMVITAFPIIVVYPFLQKYFVKGVMIGSLKG